MSKRPQRSDVSSDNSFDECIQAAYLAGLAYLTATQEDTDAASADNEEPPANPGKPPRFLGLLEAPNHSGPSNYHSGSKRAFNDQAANNSTKPDAKRSCEVGEYMAQLSQSIVARTNWREREKQNELADIDEAVAIMKSDGVEQGSELQYEALEIFRCPINRHFYKKSLETPKARIDWLKWQIRKKKSE